MLFIDSKLEYTRQLSMTVKVLYTESLNLVQLSKPGVQLDYIPKR